MDKELKDKIKVQAYLYKKMYPEEDKAVQELVKQKRDNLVLSSGEVVGDHVIDRILGDTPEILYHTIFQTLTADEWVQFTKVESQRWFFTIFKEWRVVKDI